ncbi:hypothetical protein HK101_010769, partial [Irineochytrium annulatum]
VRPPPVREGHQPNQRRLALNVIPGANAVSLGRKGLALSGGGGVGYLPTVDEGLGGSEPASPAMQASSPVKDGAGRQFTYDAVFGPEETQTSLYDNKCASLVEQFLDGYNVTIFAYGQTSSGKTFTMGSSNNSQTSEEDMGIIPRAINQVMNSLQMQHDADPLFTHSVRCNFLEIYQEQVRDLLHPDTDPKDIAIREDRTGAIVVAGVHDRAISTADDLLAALEMGGNERSTGDTRMHLLSSRSHAIFTIVLEQRRGAGDAVVRCSKLHLVDLAGSERLKRTGAEGVRFRESVKINSGLLALGNVIGILGSVGEGGGMANPHVPYRDSKLTRLLQDSLGGNSKTLMLACVSPCDEDYEETLNTLKYADRARKIQNKPVINTAPAATLAPPAIDAAAAAMQMRIDLLEGKLREFESGGTAPAAEPGEMAEKDGKMHGDPDGDEWMGNVLEELKNRTIRGTNAVKALRQAMEEKDILLGRIEELEAELEASQAAIAESQQRQLNESTRITATEELHERQAELREREAELRMLADAFVDLGRRCPPGAAGVVLDRVSSVVLRYLPDFEGFVTVDEEQPDEPHVGLFPRIGGAPSRAVAAAPQVRQPPSTAPSGSNPRYQRRRALQERASSVDTSALDELRARVERLEADLDESELGRARALHELEAAREVILRKEDALDQSVSEIERLETLNAQLVLDSKVRASSSSRPQTAASSRSEAAIQTDGAAMVSIEEMTARLTARNRRSERDEERMDEHAEELVGPDGSFGPIPGMAEFVAVNAASERGSAMGRSPIVGDAPEGALSPSGPFSPEPTADLSAANRARVDYQKELALKAKEVDKLRHQHAERVQRLEKEAEAAGREVAKLKAELDDLALSKEKLKEESDRKIKQLEAQIQKAKGRMKEQERTAKEKEQADRRTQELQQEIERLGVALNNAKRKSKEDQDKLSDAELRRQREVAALNKAREEDAKRLRALENASEVARKKFDRKVEEMAAYSKKVKDGAAVAANAAAGGAAAEKAEKGSKTAKSERGRSRRRADSLAVEREAAGQEVPAVEEPPEELKQELKKATESVAGAESEIEAFRRYHELNMQIREVKRKVDTLTSEITLLESAKAEGPEETGGAKMRQRIHDMKAERKTLARHLADLREERKEAEAALKVFESQTKSAAGMATPDVLARTVAGPIEPEPEWDALAAEFSDDGEMVELLGHLRASKSLPEARSMVIGCMRELADVRLAEAGARESLEQLEQKTERIIRAYEKKLAKTEAEYEMQLMAYAAQTTVAAVQGGGQVGSRFHELEDAGCQTETMMGVPVPPAPSGEIDRLQGELSRYMRLNKELKGRLKELLSAGGAGIRGAARAAEPPSGAGKAVVKRRVSVTRNGKGRPMDEAPDSMIEDNRGPLSNDIALAT